MVDYFLLGQLDMLSDHFILAIRTLKVATEKGTEKQNTRNAHERIHGQTTGEPVRASELVLLESAYAVRGATNCREVAIQLLQP